jgi:cytochrome c
MLQFIWNLIRKSLLVPFIVWLGWFGYTTVDNKRKDQLELLRTQISELYGPTYNLSAAMQSIWNDLKRPNPANRDEYVEFLEKVSLPLGGQIEEKLFSAKQVIRCPETRDELRKLVSFVESSKFDTSPPTQLSTALYPKDLSASLLRELNALHKRENFLDDGFQGLFIWRNPLPPCKNPLAVLLAEADDDQGKQDAQDDCGRCHSFLKETDSRSPSWGIVGTPPDLIGPPLWGVVGRQIGMFSGFKYSDSLKAKSNVWTYDKLDAFIKSPQSEAPGTMMGVDYVPKETADVLHCVAVLLENQIENRSGSPSLTCAEPVVFPGEQDPRKRANILAYLRTLAEVQVPFTGGIPSADGSADPP